MKTDIFKMIENKYREVILALLEMNGGPIAADDTIDNVDYVMVRLEDFKRLENLIKNEDCCNPSTCY